MGWMSINIYKHHKAWTPCYLDPNAQYLLMAGLIDFAVQVALHDEQRISLQSEMLKSVTGSTWGPWEFHSELEMGKSWIHLDGISYLLSKVESIWASEQMSKPGMQLKAMSSQVGVSISRLKVQSVSWFGPFQIQMFALWVRLKKHTIIWIYLDIWDDGIMSASCFPTNPNCSRCLMIKVC